MTSKSPFPGMDPWMEATWGDVHAALIVYAREAIKPQLSPGFRARIQQRIFFESVDAPLGDPITQGFVEISDAWGTVITVLEFVSPSNKVPGSGRTLYLDQQGERRDAGVNLVEVDLVRAGERATPITPEQLAPQYQTPYHAIISRATKPDRTEVYAISLREPLPAISIPLRPTEADVVLPLQMLIEKAYDLGGYDVLDYSKPPVPALTGSDGAWALDLLSAAKRI